MPIKFLQRNRSNSVEKLTFVSNIGANRLAYTRRKKEGKQEWEQERRDGERKRNPSLTLITQQLTWKEPQILK